MAHFICTPFGGGIKRQVTKTIKTSIPVVGSSTSVSIPESVYGLCKGGFALECVNAEQTMHILLMKQPKNAAVVPGKINSSGIILEC